MKKINAIGLMSGSSLDGLDLAYCTFILNNNKWSFEIVSVETISYTTQLQRALKDVMNASAYELMHLNKELGTLFGNEVNKFIEKHTINRGEVDLIASHGHTVYHQPNFGISTQIGCGATINALTQIKTICDFRSTDVALSGQGAPLVPIGDKLLFSKYDACLNLGGIANISYQSDNRRKAYDICFANLPLNHFCRQYLNCQYDEHGKFGKQGEVNQILLSQLEKISFYTKSSPKSLGREDFENEILPQCKGIEPKEVLTTFYHHFTDIISKELDAFTNVLITGGGAYNSYFIELIKSKTKCKLIIPNSEIIEFKEALIFAFLGSLNHSKIINVLKTVTGAKNDTISGAVYDAFRS